MSLVQFFDWDDTLYPSTYMAGRSILPYGGTRLPADLVEPFKVLTESIVSLLTHALNLGNIVIVTNADLGWVELCVKAFMPGLKETLFKIQVIPAHPSNFLSKKGDYTVLFVIYAFYCVGFFSISYLFVCVHPLTNLLATLVKKVEY